ncbi:MAG: hypothetical protein CMM49_00030 [Rhodospirillaceae bacterium]|jgi:hypothetical protein|nr:hypothetical protein [Rhodospirillaceae bacterium]|tara:strand:- start:886 stop:1068 length:183 start_codon:yes stop_codon:yes gene_type:complete
MELELLTPNDASKMLGIHRKTFEKLDNVPFVLLGKRKRYKKEDLIQYINDRSYEPLNNWD